MHARQIGKQLAWLMLIVIYSVYALLLASLSIWFLFSAQTWTGRGLATLVLILVILPATLIIWPRARARRKFFKRMSIVLSLTGLLLAGSILLTTPGGRLPSDSPVRQRFTRRAPFSLWTLSNILPEMEQINLGFQVMPHLDPIFTADQAQRVAVPTFKIYRELESDPNFHELGSAMSWVYADLAGDPFDVGHYYLYVPRQHHDGPLPAIVFLHGSAGNFKGYLWQWAKLADQQGMVVIAPSYGFGDWSQASGLAAIQHALDDAATQVALDPTHIYLAGLSNGGLGVSRAAFAEPDRYRGLIFISPVMDTAIVDGAAFLSQWRDRPVLVMAGEADERVPYSYVAKRVAILQTAGVRVTHKVYPGADHFAFFTQADEVLDDISQWLANIGQS